MSILLVEDDAPLAMAIDYTLKKQGFQVTMAKSIKEAYALYDSTIDIILLDVTLPDGNGFDFCTRIREQYDVPIIFMTALDDEANVVMGLNIGGDDYITKPVRAAELISRIKAILRRKKDIRYLVSGNITVEPLKCRVLLNGAEACLTAIEYKLLLILIENKNLLLSRNEIIEKLWDMDGNFVDYNTLNVYMKRLREKIETGNPAHIETVRGKGYIWRDEVG